MNYITDITDIEALVAEKLADSSEITPQEIRECFGVITAFIKKISPLASSVFSIGDVTSSDNIRTVNLPYNVGTADYSVKGCLVSKGANWNDDNDAFVTIKDKADNSFKILLHEVAGQFQDLDFEWAIYPKNT